MSDLDLAPLKRRGLSVLRLAATDWTELADSRSLGRRFTSVFPHSVARAGKPRTPVLIVVAGGKVSDDPFGIPDKYASPHVLLGWVRTIQAVATRDSRVSFDHIQASSLRDLEELMDGPIPPRLRAGAESLLKSKLEFDVVSPKLSHWLLERLAARPTENGILRRLIALTTRPTTFRNAVALQQDALTLALKAFGTPDAAAIELDFGATTTALAGVRLREDAVIEHDARWIPGWGLDDSDVTGRAVFRQQDQELHVFTANKQPLEQLFGVDLIYLNETRRSLVMVQYKMMEPMDRQVREVQTYFGTRKELSEQEWVAPIDDQFRDEVARMERFDRDTAGPDSYRMSPSPFYFKLVRRNRSTDGPGILMSLGHIRHLLAKGQLRGPRGGLRIAYGELKGHYLRGETFVDLVRSGYIGSHQATTTHLEALIDATLAGGRAAVAAIQRELADDDRTGMFG